MPLAATIDLPDRYRVVRHIASGGMASVWEVEDLLLGRLVAVKVLGAQFAADPGARERFQREARTAAQVSDQTNVVTIYDIGEHGDDAFIVMEHFAGGTVADRLRAARDGGERVPRDTAMRWLREAAAGLDVAHAAGIVHRDVKPANLLLDAQGRLAVGDFGIARLADDTQMTQTGQVLGTAAYISPEQALGQPATAASDRYALAVVAYELLTGSRPFAGGPPTAQARQHAEVPPPPASQALPGLPPSLDGVLARGLAKDPERRPRSAGELVAGIETALDESAGIEPTRAFQAVGPVDVAVAPRTPPAPAPVARLKPSPPPEAPRDLGAAVGPAGGPPSARGGAGAPPSARAGASASPVRGSASAPPSARAGASAPPSARGGASAQPSARGGASAPSARGDASAPPSARGDASAPPPARGQRRPPWPLIGATAVVAATIALVLVLAGGRDGSPRQSAHQRTSAKTASRTSTTAAVAPQPPPPPAAPKNVGTGGETPAALNDRGHRLLQQGQYGEAVAPLRAAVQGYKAAGETGLPYAFALYNLAVALNRSGNPGEAIPLLRERLQFDNQRQTVQAELDNALSKVGGTAPAAGSAPNAKGKHLGKQKGKRD